MKRKLVALIALVAVLLACLSTAALAAGIDDAMKEYGITAADVEFIANIFKQMNEGNDNGLREGQDYYETELKLAKLGAAMGNGELALWVGEIYQGGHVAGLTEAASVETAIEWWEKAVELGQPRGWTNIGLLYAHNNIPGGGKNFGDVAQDDATALTYLTKACEAGDTKAPRYLAQFYEKGRGCEQSDEEALKYYLIAAGLDDITANANVGDFYFQGRGAQQDYQKARQYYGEAAASVKVVPGVAQARYQLGVMYEKGLGANADLEGAIAWYQSAAEAGSEDAAAALQRLSA